MERPISSKELNTSAISPVFPRNTIRRRESLIGKLYSGLGSRVIVVQAGAGGGKSCLLAGFANELSDTHHLQVAWLTLDNGHKDSTHFLGDFVLSLRAIRPDLGQITLAALAKRRNSPRQWEYVLETFCREIYEAELGRVVIILDQFEKICMSPVVGTIDYLIRILAPSFSFILSTRQAPDLPSLPRLKTQGEVWSLSTNDLCFSIEEARELLCIDPDNTLSEEMLESLMERTGGWPALVKIAGDLAISKGQQALLSISSPFPEAYEYLQEEVFSHEPPSAQNFLMGTSLVDEISPELGRVLANDSISLETLARLERGDYFVSVAGTGVQTSYRHNPLFRDFLLRKTAERLTKQQVCDIHHRLAEFYTQTQRWDAAIQHFLQAAGYDEAEDLIVPLAEATIASNNLETLAGWIDAFPAYESTSRPWLLFYRGVVHRVKGEWESALSSYNRAIEIFRATADNRGLARALWYSSQILAYRRNQRVASILAEEALSYLGQTEAHSRAWILHNMGNCHFELGQMEDAVLCHKEAEELFVVLGDIHGEMMENHALGLALHRLGYLKEAQERYLRALGLQATSGDINTLCWIQSGLAHLRAIKGEFPDAEAELKEVVEIARTHHLSPVETFALTCLSDICLDLGSYDEAEIYYQQALSASEGFDDDGAKIDLHFRKVELDLRLGQTDAYRKTHHETETWLVASNLQLQRVSSLLLQAFSSGIEHRYDEAWQQASEARELSRLMGAKYHESQACYLLSHIHLRLGEYEASANMIDALVTTIDDEGYTSFLLRDPKITAALMANALLYLPTRDRLVTLIERVVRLRSEVTTQLLDELAAVNSSATPKDTVLDTSYDFASYAPIERLTGTDRPNGLSVPEKKGMDTADSGIEVHFLGPLRVRRGGHLITDRAWRTSKAKELFAYMLTRSDGSASRDELLEVLWPNVNLDSAVSNFHFTLHSLRHAFEPHLPAGSRSSILVLTGKRYRLELPSQTWHDVLEFKNLNAEAAKMIAKQQVTEGLELLERAVAIYEGDYLADFYVDWVEQERTDLCSTYLNALRQLAWASYSRKAYDQAVRYSNAILSKDNFVEDANRLLMRVACETGNSALALRQYNDLVRCLETELNARPELATQQLYRRIKNGTYKRPSY